jgi:hypothetical protein
MPVHKFQRVIKRIDRALSGPTSLFPDQFLYGAREIFCAYANLDNKTIFTATFEHGWAIESAKPVSKINGRRYPHFSWCEERVKRSKVQNTSIIPIGAPFIYLVNMLNSSLNKLKEVGIADSNDVIFFPTHSNEVEFQNSKAQIELFKKSYNPKNSTACLYWAEFVNPCILEQYRQAGFKNVVTAGFSGQMEHTGLGYSARELAASSIGGRNLFYLNLLSFLIKHKKVVLGGFGSICFYAAYLEKDIDFLKINSNYEHLAYDNKQYSEIKTYYSEADKFISNYMQVPFFEINFSSVKFRELAGIELGINHFKSPENLQEILNRHSVEQSNSISSEETKIAIINFYKNFLALN